MKKIFLLLVLLLGIFFLAACKGNEEDKLTITSSLRGQVIKEIEITCPKDSDCPWVQAFAKVDVAPVPADVMCTRIYGGPEELSLLGQINGKEIEAQFNRSGGCEIARFDSLLPLLRAAQVDREDLFPKDPL